MKTYTAYVFFPARKWRGHIMWPSKEDFRTLAVSSGSVEEIDVEATGYTAACYEVVLKLYEEYEKGAAAIYVEERVPEVQIGSIS